MFVDGTFFEFRSEGEEKEEIVMGEGSGSTLGLLEAHYDYAQSYCNGK